MLAQDVSSYAQQLCGEQNVGQRWTVAQWVAATDRAQKLLVRELKWPPGRFFFTTTPGVQEYQLQEVIKIEQVYLNGQIIVQTDLAALEGQQIEVSDQSGTVGGPTGLVSSVSAPTVGGGQYTPAWSSQAAASYPAANASGTTLNAVPWFVGQRPMYYCQGGNIGFVPAPIVAYPVICRVVKQPALLQNALDPMVLPDVCLDALAWKVAEYFYYADRDQSGAPDSRNYASQQYQAALIACKDWRKTYEGNAPTGPIPRTYRTDFRKGQRRNYNGGTE